MNNIQVVILAGGKGTRLRPLTDNVPKVLVDVNGKSILEHSLDRVVSVASGIVIVVGYLGDKICDKIGDSYRGVSVRYCVQKEQLGTGDALLCAKDVLDDEFLVLNGDDVYSKEDLIKVCYEKLAVLGYEADDPKLFSVLEVDSDGFLIDLVEKPKKPVSNLVNIGVYRLNKSVFDYDLTESERGEFEIVDYVTYLSSGRQKVKVIRTNFWVPVGNFDQLEKAKEILKN